MMKYLRIWRVVPTCKTGVQAPYFFVETTLEFKHEAFKDAQKKANSLCCLTKFPNWDLKIEKMNKRKDKFGRYKDYHQ